MGVQVQFKQPLLQFKGIDKWLNKKNRPEDDGPFATEIKQIKEILKDHDTQNNLLPLKFHRHVKPPVHPPKRLLTEKEVVSGKMVPFSKTMVVRQRIAFKKKIPAMKISPFELSMKRKTTSSRRQERAPPIFMYK